MKLLYLFANGGLFLLTFLLFVNAKKVNTRANRWFAILLFLVSCIFLEDSIKFLNLQNEELSIYIIQLSNLPIFSTFPILFLCITYYINPQKVFKLSEYIHFIPQLFYILFPIVLFAIFRMNDSHIESFMDENRNMIQSTFSHVFIAQSLFYIPLSLYYIDRHQKKIVYFSSYPESINLGWLQYFLFGLSIMTALGIIEIFFPIIQLFTPLGYFIGVYYLSFFALNQREIYPFNKLETQSVIEVVNKIENTQKNSKSNPNIDIERDSERLKAFLEKEKPFLDNELTLPKLSQYFEMSTNNLSFLLNEGFRANFYEVINQYRVEESKKLLTNKKFGHLNMLGVAFESGFNSKTVFNTAFKKYAGMTPTQFKKAYTIDKKNTVAP